MAMLDASFVNQIESLATRAGGAKFTQVPGDDRRHIVVLPNGETRDVETPKSMVAKLDRVESVFALAAEWKSEDFAADRPVTRGAKLFLSQEKLVLVSDIEDRRERAFCELKMTRHAKELVESRAYAQDDFVDLMRFYFTERIDKTVIDRVKAIRFKKIEEGASGVGHQAGNASISREVQIQSLAGGGEIPDLVTITVRPFVCFDFETEVTCGLRINLERKTFQLIPIAEELDELFSAALNKIASLRKAEDHPPLYFGKVNIGSQSDE